MFPSSAVVHVLAVVALLATITGRALAPALPGTAGGIDAWITAADWTAVRLTQLFAFGGTAACVWLLIATLRDRGLAVTFRLTVVPLGAGIVTLVMMSASRPLAQNAILLLALGTAALAIAAMLPALPVLETRAVGLALGVTSVASTAYVASRVLALKAGDEALPSLFVTGRAVATAALALDAVAIVLAAVWLGTKRWRIAAGVGAAILVVAVTISWGATVGSRYGASIWQVLASRALAELTRNPAPLVDSGIRYFVQVAGLLVAIAALVPKRPRSVVPAALALILIARASTDVPLAALAITLAALMAPLAAVHWAGRPAIPATPRAYSEGSAPAAQPTDAKHEQSRT